MLVTLKIIHLLCLYAAGAAGVGSAVLMARTAAEGGPPAPVVAGSLGILGRIGLVAILLIWLTGVALVWTGPGDLALGWAFFLKLAAAALVLVAVLALTRTRLAAARAGAPPDPARMKSLGQAAFAGTVLAVILAVIAFN